MFDMFDLSDDDGGAGADDDDDDEEEDTERESDGGAEDDTLQHLKRLVIISSDGPNGVDKSRWNLRLTSRFMQQLHSVETPW